MNFENKENNNNLEISALINAIWSSKFSILLSIIFFAACAAIFALTLPDKYKSTVLLTPASGISQSSDFKGLSPLAGLAGISLPSASNEAVIAIEVLKSRIFIENFIDKHNILIPLMASQDWNASSGEIVLNKKIYNNNLKKWVRKSQPTKPSLHEAYDFWIENIFSLKEDRENSFLVVNITHYSPILAQEWLALLINELNNFMRDLDVREANLANDYLQLEVSKTTSEELRPLLFGLIQSNAEKKMLAYSRPEYIFRIIDPPIVPEKKYLPNRLIIVLMGIVTGTLFGFLLALFSNRKKIFTF